MKTVTFFSILILIGQTLNAQKPAEYPDYEHIYKGLEIDSVVVTASRFDVGDFIRMVENDETFYLAFANLRKVSYTANNSIAYYGRKKKQLASYQSQTIQSVDGKNCRTMQIIDPKTTGNYYKNRKRKEPRFYTSKMYEKLFFTQGKVCNDPQSVKVRNKPTGIDKHIEELKKLIFKPGSKADVPMIANRTAVFSKRMSKFYDYKIQEKEYNGRLCHVFIIETKEKYRRRRENQTVINYLETYFEKLTHQVVARNYEIEYHGIFDVKVKMDIAVTQLANGEYIPTRISYDGRWVVPTQKPENCQFTMQFSDFKIRDNNLDSK